MRRAGLVLAFLLATFLASAAEEKTDGALVSYEGIAAPYARAIARVVASARAVAVERFGMDMPDTIEVRVSVEPKGRPSLFNDGHDRFFLTVRSENDLRRPAESGIFTLYGLCHEVGHLAMYRVLRDHSWLTTAAAEGWAHCLGSRLVDAVHAREGAELWPHRYNYLDDGTARLRRQLAAPQREPVTAAAGLWMELGGLIGDKGLQPILEAWSKAEFDPADPAIAARKALIAADPKGQLSGWWAKAEPVFVLKRPKSNYAARTAPAKALTGTPTELIHDDGKPAGKKSMAGGGHAVRFKTTGQGWYLTAVSIHGSRYGYPQPPKEDFHVWLCDAEFKPIADFPFPYSSFAWGNERWVTLSVTPTRVPTEFIVCVGFNPTATKGVYVHYDKEASGDSFFGLPGEAGRPCEQWDWLIRAKVDQLKAANPLTTGS